MDGDMSYSGMDGKQLEEFVKLRDMHLFNNLVGNVTLGLASPIINTMATVGVVKRIASYYDIKGTAVSGGRFGIYSGRNMNDGQQRYY